MMIWLRALRGGLLGVLSLAVCGVTAASGQAPYKGGNWVLDHWRAVDPNCSFIVEEMYTPAEYQKLVRGENGWHHPYRVTYNVSAGKVWTHIDGTGWYATLPVDANHIKESFERSCIYVRVR